MIYSKTSLIFLLVLNFILIISSGVAYSQESNEDISEAVENQNSEKPTDTVKEESVDPPKTDADAVQAQESKEESLSQDSSPAEDNSNQLENASNKDSSQKIDEPEKNENKATNEQQKSKDTKMAEYNKPLYFDLTDESLKSSPLILDWDLSSKENLMISGVEFNDKKFFVGMFRAWKLDTKLKNILSDKEKNEFWFVVRWPETLSGLGVLEAFNRSGNVIWRKTLSTKERDSWLEQKEKWEISLDKLNKTKNQKYNFSDLNFGFNNSNLEISKLAKINEPIRFCFTARAAGGLYTRMCSGFRSVVKAPKKDPFIKGLSESGKNVRVFAFRKEAKLTDSQEIKPNKPVQFLAELSSGASLEFYAKPLEFNLVDFYQTSNQDVCKIIAFGSHPSLPITILTKNEKGFFERIIGRAWSATISDEKELWEVNVPCKKPELSFPGVGGGLFRKKFSIVKIPSEKERLFIKENTITGTYIDGAHITGKIPEGVKLTSTQQKVDVNPLNNNEFEWTFAAPKKGEINKSYLTIQGGPDTFKSYYELYRGFAREISTRLTGIAGTGGNLIMMGELAYNHWFESMFGSKSYRWSQQRWGLSTKYFMSANNLSISPVNSPLQTFSIDLKYRLDPGLWGKDETWGFESGLYQINMNVFQPMFWGGGFFWARSMPRVFDNIMNFFKMFRYPKWVDLEFIYYPISFTQNIVVQNIGAGMGNWQLNFHGKVMWTKQIFGEAGFGVKQMDFTAPVQSLGTTKLRMQFTSFYGTIGLGYSF